MGYPQVVGIIAATSYITFLISTQFNSPLTESTVEDQSNYVSRDELAQPISRDELDSKLAEIERLRVDVADLSRKVSQLQESEMEVQPTDRRQSGVTDEVHKRDATNYSIADRFEYGEPISRGTGLDSPHLEGVIYASVSEGVEVYSTECRGALCKVYVSGSGGEAHDAVSSNEFIENVTTSLNGNVNIYFDDESGQKVIYIESVD